MKDFRSFARMLLVFSAVMSGSQAAAPAQCVTSNRPSGQNTIWDNYHLSHNLSGQQAAALNQAMGEWNSSNCNTDGHSFPKFQTAPIAGARTIHVEVKSGFNPINDISCGNFSVSTITIYQKAKKMDGTTYFCTQSMILQDVMAHELGHVLGFRDSNCPGYGMQDTAFTPTGNYVPRNVKASECSKARETHVTPMEQMIEHCQSPNPPPGCDEETIPCEPCGSPIAVDIGGDGFLFEGIRGGVDFDIDRDLVLERTGWTNARSVDPFLCYDRNRNGIIDNGGELFGDATLHLSGIPADHGYQPLAELEIVYGNGNGYVEVNDEIFSQLRLWFDRNQNGYSEPRELVSLADAGVVALHTGYGIDAARVDEHGNWLLFSSTAWIKRKGSIVPVETVDVFFKTRAE